jgi:hypothetical protein
MSKLLILVALLAAQVAPSDKSQITVKNSEVSSGVVIVSAVEGKTPLELQCNKGAAFCSVLEAGDYLMVRLPKNHGLYDCQDADIYPKSADPETANKIGEYCLTERK